MKGIFSTRNVVLIVTAVFLTLVSVQPRVTSWNDRSRMATIQALVEDGTFIIDETAFINTGDKVHINGHYYSDKPVMLSVIGALVYYPLHMVNIEMDTGVNLAVYIITLLIMKSFWLAGLVAFYKTLNLFGAARKTSIFITSLLGFATIYFPWSGVFNNHLAAASCLILGFYNMLDYRYSSQSGFSVFFAGLFFSLAGCIDHATAVFYPAFFIYLLIFSGLKNKHNINYLVPLVVTALPVLYINYEISGQLLPFQLVPEFFDYQGSRFASEGSLTGTTIKDLADVFLYAFNMFFGVNGFLVYNPLLLLSIPYLFLEISRGGKYKLEVVIIVICMIIIALFYILTSRNYGGGSYSIRWFVPFLPFLMLFLYRYVDGYSHTIRRSIFVALICTSCLFSVIGAIDPFSELRHSKMGFRANINKVMDYIYELDGYINKHDWQFHSVKG